MNRGDMELTAPQWDRACGTILGAAVGDSLGAGYEFGSAPLGPEGPAMIGGGLGNFAPGEWTDDTSMTTAILRVAASRTDLRTVEALDEIARWFSAWYAGDPADIGIQTQAVLASVSLEPTGAELTAAAKAYSQRVPHSAGNGSLMRTAPVALAHLDDPVALVEAAYAVSALTHVDPLAQEACAIWCLMIRTGVLEGDFVVPDLSWLNAQSRSFWEEKLAECAEGAPSRFSPNGFVVTALQAAWASILAGASTGLEQREAFVESLHTAIAIGDDTDTVASIAGALLGARWGMSAIPAGWLEIVHGYPGWVAADLERLALQAVQAENRRR